MKLDIRKTEEILAPDGLLSKSLKGFESRIEQKKMLRNVIEAYHSNHICLIEAGTGTGKSIAYLLPAILWALTNQERTVISTNTITLQEQLIKKDIPFLIEILKLDIKAVLVKGMGNYLCLRKLEESLYELNYLPPQEAEELKCMEAWGKTTRDGTRASLPMAASAACWDRVSAESDSCNHTKCPHFNNCFFFRAREQANDAQILVVNHHLLFADLTFRSENNNYDKPSILPAYKRLIIDEAHNLEDIATEYFATRISRNQLMRILGQLASEKHGKAFGKVPALRQKLIEYLSKKNEKMEPEIQTALQTLNIELPAERRNLIQQIGETFHAYIAFLDQLHLSTNSNTTFENESLPTDHKLRLLPGHQKLSSWIEDILPITQKLITSSQHYIQSLLQLEKKLLSVKDEKLINQISGLLFDIKALAKRLEKTVFNLQEFLLTEVPPSKVRWMETEQWNMLTNTQLVNADLEIAGQLAESLFSKFSTIILCSATLTSNNSFEYIKERLGLKSQLLNGKTITEKSYNSPFHYQTQTLLAIPTDMPSPTDPRFTEAAAEKIWLAIQASNGNAFVLFTSFSMLKACYQILSKRLEERRFKTFKQGDENRLTLLNKFKTTEHSVLFGTDSFWEGVDVVGDALRCVVLVKIPFKVPNDPITQARAEAIIARGNDPFTHYSMPSAIVKFKQGFGRLIRNKKDRGCVVCLDTRLINKSYGKFFLNSLPKCQEIFDSSDKVHQAMITFYQKTYYLVAKQST